MVTCMATITLLILATFYSLDYHIRMKRIDMALKLDHELSFSVFRPVFNIFTGIDVTIFMIFRLRFLGLNGPCLGGPLWPSLGLRDDHFIVLTAILGYGHNIGPRALFDTKPKLGYVEFRGGSFYDGFEAI